MTGLRPCDESTRDDVYDVVSDRFSPQDCRLVDRYLKNPLRRFESSIGDVVYERGRAVGFQAAILRQLYLNGVPLRGVVGGMLGMMPNASPVLLLQLMKASIAPRGGSVVFYANTANPQSSKMNKLLGVKGTGPLSCAAIRFAITAFPRCLSFILPKPTSRRLSRDNVKQIDDFWSRYMSSCHGLVSSRSVEELDWIFGDRLDSGQCVLLGEFDGGALSGYIVIGQTHHGRRWLVLDWIALGDDQSVLSRLMASAVRFVRRETRAMFLESIGFPEKAQSILARALPFVRKAPSNSFIWKFTDGRKSGIPEGSWFFGPYDGDRCM